jgi:hypothetical protein
MRKNNYDRKPAVFVDRSVWKGCPAILEQIRNSTLPANGKKNCPSYDVLIYADMAQWKVQQRFRRKKINDLGMENRKEPPSLHYKRGHFADWIVCDSLKIMTSKKGTNCSIAMGSYLYALNQL